ncbi:hypothetical protein ABW19_dt0206609 [Dactylella cylindrospora]|nr:hypothetical protein ABW19_dt0206609 [Dactylella cylindrospora]
MDNRNVPTLAKSSDPGVPPISTGPKQIGPVRWPQDPRTPAAGGQNLESTVRGMLLHGNGSAPGSMQQSPHTPGNNNSRRRHNQGFVQTNNPPSLGSFSHTPASPTQPGLLPSPRIHHRQHPPTLQRSSTHPAQGYVPPFPPPGLDRASTFHESSPGSSYIPRGQHHHSPRSQRGSYGGGYGGGQNGFRNPSVPQMNNTLHFPPLGSTPPQMAVPLSERFASTNSTSPQQSGNMGFHNDKHHSPTYQQGFPGAQRHASFPDSPPQSRRGRPYHTHRGSRGGGGRRAFAPLDYTVINDYAKQIVEETSPDPEETAMKTNMLRRISDICDNLVPGSRIIPFGSLVSGFATKGADMDLIFVHDTLQPAPSSNESNIPVRLAGEFLRRGFEVDLLIKTRVPILKLKTPSLKPKLRPVSPETPALTPMIEDEDPWPEEISCDIGFKAHLGITNSHFFRTYGHCDDRFREMVLFIKQWSKNRDLNSPYFGTLSSYGYVLMVAHFLINVVQPPVLPNLQLIPPEPNTPASELTQDGYNIWYYKDVAKLKSGELLPGGKNEMSLGQLIFEFFQYYTTNFNFVSECITIRTPGGVIYKSEKGWTSAKTQVGEMNNTYQDRYLLALEDPFEITHNVGRTCSTTGVKRIRNELHRATHIIRTLSTQSEIIPGRNNPWETPIAVEDLMFTVRLNNGGYRNRRVNQRNLVDWIRNDWTVGKCLAQIDAAAEDVRRRRELGLPDDAELPPESDGSEETDSEDESSDDDSIRIINNHSQTEDQTIGQLRNMTIS